jgi:hypothetical protein
MVTISSELSPVMNESRGSPSSSIGAFGSKAAGLLARPGFTFEGPAASFLTSAGLTSFLTSVFTSCLTSTTGKSGFGGPPAFEKHQKKTKNQQIFNNISQLNFASFLQSKIEIMLTMCNNWSQKLFSYTQSQLQSKQSHYSTWKRTIVKSAENQYLLGQAFRSEQIASLSFRSGCGCKET